MNCSIELKYSVNEVTEFINTQIQELMSIDDPKEIATILKNISANIAKYIYSPELILKTSQLAEYITNPFSDLKNKESISAAKERILMHLKELKNYIYEEKLKFINYKSDIDEETSILILKKILNNFYEHIKSMYLDDVHGKGNIKKDQLENIKIGNEYDVQRILFSLIKPIFPNAGTEVIEEINCSTVRYDIDIESCNTTIEVKCTRPSMSERTLNEEMGSDSFHYRRKHILFFVYDKESIISNIDSYKKEYNKKFDDKFIDIVILQPINL
ncbi:MULTISPECIES: hypothetical protein [Clostridium]|uniref:Uncharacterized protein n=2 Tax=Clostridium TaxID=1485 RepID=A0A964RPP3_9CLOT|nr:hypothetical protein [Clostridium chromiireducens]MVX65729.1 hypothetical protein [Clostridium chromiireducens]